MRDRKFTEFDQKSKNTYKAQALQFKQNIDALGLFALKLS